MNHKAAIRSVIILAFFALSLMLFTMIWHKYLHKSDIAETGTVFAQPRTLDTFQLSSTENQKFSNKNLIGHWTLLFFGFTHCPDICPTTMAMLNQVYPKLITQYPTMQIAFVTVDPKQDNPKTLKNYLRAFNKNFIGLTGSTKQITTLQKQLGVTAITSNEHKIEHTASIFIVNPEGKWVALLPYGLGMDQFTDAFNKVAG